MEVLLHLLCSGGRMHAYLPRKGACVGKPIFLAVSQRQAALVKPPQPAFSQLRARDGST